MLFFGIDSSLRKLQVNIELRHDSLHKVRDTEFGFGRRQSQPRPLFFLFKHSRMRKLPVAANFWQKMLS